VIDQKERDRLSGEIAAIWPRVESGEAGLDEVRRVALSVFDRLGVNGLDGWEKHHFIWVLKGLKLNREEPKAGLHTALHGLEQTLAPHDDREQVADPSLSALGDRDLRELVAAA
jgi:hypothetical protein